MCFPEWRIMLFNVRRFLNANPLGHLRMHRKAKPGMQSIDLRLKLHPRSSKGVRVGFKFATALCSSRYFACAAL